ncbi:MAG: cell division protein FtsZ [Euryarchaeota archaeon]|nr:cell division protein FtsZ [Euryarchaeota archaeon]
MQSLVQEALKQTEKDRQQSGTEIDDFGLPQIAIVGCGGAGNNTVTRLHSMGVNGALTVAINTDKTHLDVSKADKKILIGKSLTRGLGAGGDPKIGKQAAELARDTLEEVLRDADLVFVTAGMGGGSGTGSAPVVAEVAKSVGAIVIGMVSSPFRVERLRLVKAEEGLEELRRKCDTVIVLDNNRLLEYVPNLPMDAAFATMDQLIAETVKGISETITQPSLINLDYADVRTIMSCGGVAVMLWGETNPQDNRDKSKNVVRHALNHPLLDVDYRGATGCLLHITGGPDLTLKEAEEIAELLTYELDSHANVIWGARINPNFEGRVRLMAIMTGVQSAQILGPGESGQFSRQPAASQAVETLIDRID